MSTLLNCPFCGSSNVKYQYTCGAGYVTCENCESYGAMIRSKKNDAKRMQKAIEKWNTRNDYFDSSNLQANVCSRHVVAKVSDTINQFPSGFPAP